MQQIFACNDKRSSIRWSITIASLELGNKNLYCNECWEPTKIPQLLIDIFMIFIGHPGSFGHRFVSGLSRPWPSATLINAFPSPQHYSWAHKLNPETLHSFLTQNTRSRSHLNTPDPIRINSIACTYLSLVLVPCLLLPLIRYLYLSLVPSVWHS